MCAWTFPTCAAVISKRPYCSHPQPSSFASRILPVQKVDTQLEKNTTGPSGVKCKEPPLRRTSRLRGSEAVASRNTGSSCAPERINESANTEGLYGPYRCGPCAWKEGGAYHPCMVSLDVFLFVRHKDHGTSRDAQICVRFHCSTAVTNLIEIA